jgi:hypothetical protein
MKRLRRMFVVPLGACALAVSAPVALADPPASPPRADTYVQVWCLAPGETVATPYERVDSQSVDQGNKDVQVAHYGLHHEGWLCQIGPF